MRARRRRFALVAVIGSNISCVIDGAEVCEEPRVVGSDVAWIQTTLPSKNYHWPATKSIPGGPWTSQARNIDLKVNKLCADLKRIDGTWSRDCTLFNTNGEWQNYNGAIRSLLVAPTFENVDGKFSLVEPKANQGLPRGSWSVSARHAKLEGDVVCADLPRLDGSFSSRQCVKFEDGQVLENIDGKFRLDVCPCQAGFSVQGVGGCADFDECLTNRGGCHDLAECVNTVGSHHCGPCPDGYRGTGDTVCIDIDECVDPVFMATYNCVFAGCCGPDDTCLNEPGKWRCLPP